jgi:hypothetical protein
MCYASPTQFPKKTHGVTGAKALAKTIQPWRQSKQEQTQSSGAWVSFRTAPATSDLQSQRAGSDISKRTVGRRSVPGPQRTVGRVRARSVHPPDSGHAATAAACPFGARCGHVWPLAEARFQSRGAAKRPRRQAVIRVAPLFASPRRG